jgi:hypothetical protein
MATGCWRYEAVHVLVKARNRLQRVGAEGAAGIIFGMLTDEYCVGSDCSATHDQRCHCETRRRRMGSPIIIGLGRERVEVASNFAHDWVSDPGDSGYWYTE